MVINSGGMVIVKGDNIEEGGVKIVKNYYGIDDNDGKLDFHNPITEEQLVEKVNFVRDKIGNSQRLWFPVCKSMMWHKLVPEGDFNGAVAILERLFPDLKLNAKDLSSMNVFCFQDDLEKWTDEKAPVHGATFNKYYSIAELMEVK